MAFICFFFRDMLDGSFFSLIRKGVKEGVNFGRIYAWYRLTTVDYSRVSPVVPVTLQVSIVSRACSDSTTSFNPDPRFSSVALETLRICGGQQRDIIYTGNCRTATWEQQTDGHEPVRNRRSTQTGGRNRPNTICVLLQETAPSKAFFKWWVHEWTSNDIL